MLSRKRLDYDLPPHLIAQQPLAERDQSRLLVVRRDQGSLAHHAFTDLPELLDPRDLLVLNDTRVLPARLLGIRERTGGKWEGLFLRLEPDGTWEMLSKTRGRLFKHETILVDGCFRLKLVQQLVPGRWRMAPESNENFVDLLNRFGRVPLPCYIRRGCAEGPDRERYQTVYARQAGAVAAPTAGLHFTPRVFDRLRQRGITWTFITLHVGAGTFQPIKVEDYRQHRMHAEWGQLPEESALAIHACRQRGGRVVAVGTTAVRVLETVAASGPVRPWSGDTELFIYPPYSFRIVDGLVTNFHLPGSTLLLLVAAFAGEKGVRPHLPERPEGCFAQMGPDPFFAGVDLQRRAYTTAIAEAYRFYSYGDAMLIL